MQNLQPQLFGCQELSQADAHDINGGLIDLGFLKIDLVNADGKINLGITIDPNGLGGLPGGGGTGGLGNILSPVTNLLNSLLGGLGGVVNPL
ncbi:hypothetical protein [Chitinophaga barathri]|nr:hypothetical protein [Chitinophaga barathri]